jgi:hypothetical protein
MLSEATEMVGCNLHVLGLDFNPHLALKKSKLQPYSAFNRGDARFPKSSRDRRPHKTSGFKCVVSDMDRPLSEQVVDAIAFLKKHQADLRQMAAAPGIESMTLDFGYNVRIDNDKCDVQCDTLPPELIALCGALGIGIELSLYPAANRGSSED